MPRCIVEYHIHVYFSGDPVPVSPAMKLRAELAQRCPEARFGRVQTQPVGPHPKPMYAVYLPPPVYEGVYNYLVDRWGLRDELSILLHPVYDGGTDELHAHTKAAEWLGEELALDTSKLKS